MTETFKKRFVYTNEELRRLRPPPPSTPQPTPTDSLRSAPLSVPRRPSPSPNRSPPTGRHRPPSLSSSPPSGGFLPPTTFDSANINMVMNINTRAPSPLPPPGFGPPRNSSSSKAGGIGSNGQGRVTERRIARGPNMSVNFATRMAFAALQKQQMQHVIRHSVTNPQSPSVAIPSSSSFCPSAQGSLESQPEDTHSAVFTNQSRHQNSDSNPRIESGLQPAQLSRELERRNFELSSEIDRLFADETHAPESQSQGKIPSQLRGHALPHMSSQHHPYSQGSARPTKIDDTEFVTSSASIQPQGPGPSSLEDAAVTLASVAYLPSSSPDSRSLSPLMREDRQHQRASQPQQSGDISFEDFAKQLAAGAQSRVVERESEEADQATPLVQFSGLEGRSLATPGVLETNGTTQPAEHEGQSRVVSHPTRRDRADLVTAASTAATTAAATVASNAKTAEVEHDPTVAALAKWFSSLAAAADVVEGTASGNEVSRQGGTGRISGVERENKIGNLHRLEEDSGANGAVDKVNEQTIDRRVVKYVTSVLERAVNGEMMEWAQDYDVAEGEKEDECVGMDFVVEDLIEGGGDELVSGEVAAVSATLAVSALGSMMSSMKQSV